MEIKDFKAKIKPYKALLAFDYGEKRLGLAVSDLLLMTANPLTIIYLLIALIFNKFNFIIFHYLVAFIHEGSHFVMAKMLKIKVKEIEFLPIGFYLKIHNLENYPFIKQFLVLIAGPLSYFISAAILKFF